MLMVGSLREHGTHLQKGLAEVRFGDGGVTLEAYRLLWTALLASVLTISLTPHPAAAQDVGQRFRDCPTCPVMVVVPPGSFLMGSPPESEEAYEDERPQHRVTIESPFAVGVYEVTFTEWDACVNAGGCRGYNPDDWGWGRGTLPVFHVSWDDAWEYTAWLSEVTGEAYRLLSEAEWEYVARAGTRTERYWGDDAFEQCRYANGDDEYVPCSDGYEFGAPLGSFQANAFGLHDVLGNLWEWTEDCWNDDYTDAPADDRARRVGDCSRRVVRGGSFADGPGFLRSALRLWKSAEERFGLWSGFRVARAVGGPAAE